MNQPRFKFGDIVKCYLGNVFRIRRIETCFVKEGVESYLYQGQVLVGPEADYVYAVLESELELYQEPQKKKLYAYSMNESVIGETNEIRFYKKELDKEWMAFIREPEYDLEYPEAQ